jgi:hypothetical protein
MKTLAASLLTLCALCASCLAQQGRPDLVSVTSELANLRRDIDKFNKDVLLEGQEITLAEYAVNQVLQQSKDAPTAAPVAPKPAKPPAKIVLKTGPEKDALLVAVHHKDQADKELSDLNLRLQQLQTQAQAEYQRIQSKQSEATKAVEDARAAALKAMDLDPGKYVLDQESFEATPKPDGKIIADEKLKK